MTTESKSQRGSGRTFRSGPYLENLLAELERAEISSRIKQARTEAGLTQQELADLMQVHWRTIQTWEQDQRVPWDRLEDIGKATGRTRDWLLHGRDEQPAPDQTELIAAVSEVQRLLERLVALAEARSTMPQSEPEPSEDRPAHRAKS